MPSALLDRRLLFFGGKGGVGKTTLATACSLLSAERGDRTLLVSTDPAHSTADVLGIPLDAAPRSVAPNLRAVEIDPALEADQYIAEVKRRIADVTAPRIAAEVERQIDIARVSPGAEDAALFDRFTKIIGELGTTYDRVIFDTAPLGHTLRLLAMPEHMGMWIGGLIRRRKHVNVLGRMWRAVAGATAGDGADLSDPVLAALEDRRARFERARSIMTDRRQAAFVFVVVPERLPILETQRAVTVLDRYDIPIGGVIANRMAPDGLAEREGRAVAESVSEIRASFERYPLYRVPHVTGDLIGIGPIRDLAGRIARF